MSWCKPNLQLKVRSRDNEGSKLNCDDDAADITTCKLPDDFGNVCNVSGSIGVILIPVPSVAKLEDKCAINTLESAEGRICIRAP